MQVPALNSRDVKSKQRSLQSFFKTADNKQEESDGDFIKLIVGEFKPSIVIHIVLKVLKQMQTTASIKQNNLYL